MKVLKDAAVKGAHGDDLELTAKVRGIIEDISQRGEIAVRELSKTFDGWEPESFRLSTSQLDEIIDSVDRSTIADIEFAQTQIRNFAQVQRNSMLDVEVEKVNIDRRINVQGLHLGRAVEVVRVGIGGDGGLASALADR